MGINQSSKIQTQDLPFWGADLVQRPAQLKEVNRETSHVHSNIQGEKPIPKQVPRVEILVSTEHKELTPIFGTSCPPKGLSGSLRRLAFRLSEGKKAHWLLLIFADRVDVFESQWRELIQGKPYQPFKEMGLRSEFGKNRFFSRFGHHRADTKRLGQQAVLGGIVIGSFFLYKKLMYVPNK